MLYYLCRFEDIDSKINYLFFNHDTATMLATDYNEAISLISQHVVINGKLENTIVKGVDIPKGITLSYADMQKNAVFYLYKTDDSAYSNMLTMLYVVSNTGELFIMSSNVAKDFFKDKILLNGHLTNKGKVLKERGTRFTAPLVRDYKHAHTR